MTTFKNPLFNDQSLLRVFIELSSLPVYGDTKLICLDGVIRHNRLFIMLMFPKIIPHHALGDLVEDDTILLPDFTMAGLHQRFLKILITAGMANTVVNLKQSQQSMFLLLRDLSRDPSYTDADLVCRDATISYSKLLAGFLFPQLASSFAYHCPTQCTLILPDYSTQEVEELFKRKLFELENEQVNVGQVVAARGLDPHSFGRLEPGNSPDLPINFDMKMVEIDFVPKFQEPRRFDDFEANHTSFYMSGAPSSTPHLEDVGHEPQHAVQLFPLLDTSIHASDLSEKAMADKKIKPKKIGKKFNIKITPTGEKCFMCFYCDYVSLDHSHVKRHERTHTGEKPYGCSQCGKKFSQLSAKMRHEKTHTGEKPFKCRYCGKLFSRQHGLIGHERLHTGEKPFFCHFCHEKFITTREKKRHEKRMHNVNKQFTLKHEFQNIAV